MIYSILIIFMIVLDQLTKYKAVEYLSGGRTIAIIQDVFHLTLAKNTGAAFSILRDRRTLLVFLSTGVAILLVGLLVKSHKEGHSSGLLWALTLIIGGAVGNLIDRVRLGHVIDFFDFRWMNFPVFNVADIFIVLGTGLLAIMILYFKVDWP